MKRNYPIESFPIFHEDEILEREYMSGPEDNPEDDKCPYEKDCPYWNDCQTHQLSKCPVEPR
jgi:hypothetical protein